MGKYGVSEEIITDSGNSFRLREAEESDMELIKLLYYKVYGGKYTLPEVTNADKMKWAIHDPNYIWLLVEEEENLVASTIFVTDKNHRLGKSLAGVVLPEKRGGKIMKKMLRKGLDYILYEKDMVDLVYGVVRTFVTRSFHQDLKDLGFVDVGIFPNVRKVSKYETHGLKVLFKPESLSARKNRPTLIPQADAIYSIVRKRLNLEEAEVVDYQYDTPSSFENYDFYVERSPDIEWEYYKKRDNGDLLMSFYPFHYPEIKLCTPDGGTTAYIHFEERDGHGDLMGLETDQPENLTDILENVAEEAGNLGIKYLELLVDAFDSRKQIQAYEADFLPCAYFPAVEMTEKGERVDFVVMCRTFSPLEFKGIKLTDDTRAYVRTYYKLRTTKLWEDLEHA